MVFRFSGIYVVVSYVQSMVVISTKSAASVKFRIPFCNSNQIHHLQSFPYIVIFVDTFGFQPGSVPK